MKALLYYLVNISRLKCLAAYTLMPAIWQTLYSGSNGQAIIDLINVITVMLDVPAQMDAIVESERHYGRNPRQGMPAFWNHRLEFKSSRCMERCYAWRLCQFRQGNYRYVKRNGSTWMFLYWLFEQNGRNWSGKDPEQWSPSTNAIMTTPLLKYWLISLG